MSSPHSSSPSLKVEILSQGHEVLLGEVADTNAAWLAAELDALGFTLSRHHVVGDRLEDIRDLFLEISERSDVCISTGGLGPTCDDLTSEAAALALKVPLQIDTKALEQIELWFQRSGRLMPDTNRKQAYFPKEAKRIDNAFGTAPGFSFVLNRCQFYCLPGVPREMKGMFRAQLQMALQKLVGTPLTSQTVFHTVGTGESALQALLDGYPLPKDVELGFRTKGLENLVKIRYPSHFEVESVRSEITRLLSEWLFAITDPGAPQTSLEAETVKALENSGLTFFLAEPQSLGRVATFLAHCPGFLGGHIPGPNHSSHRELSNWAQQLADETGAELILVQSIQHLIGESLPTLSLGLLTPQGFEQDQRRLSQDSNRNIETACSLSLNLIRRHLEQPTHIRRS